MTNRLPFPTNIPAALCLMVLPLTVGADSVWATGVINEILFEAGAIGPFGSPAASGWQYQDLNLIARIEDAHPNRTFANGTNREARLITPFDDDPNGPFSGGGNRTLQGAFWEQTSGPVETIDADEVFYSVIEHFSDFSRSNQEWKTDLVFGKRSGLSDGTYDPAPASTASTTWTWGINSGHHSNHNGNIFSGGGATNCTNPVLGAVDCGSLGAEFSGTRYGTAASPPGPGDPTTPGTPPTATDLEKSHVTMHVFRTVVDESENPIGTEMEVNDTRGGFNGGDSGNRRDTAAGWDEAWGGNPTIMIGNEIDQASVSISRWRGAGSINTSTITSGYLDILETNIDEPDHASKGSIGMKYIRFGTANWLDVNLDGVVDVQDVGVAIANFGLSPENNTTNNVTGATFFHGDVDNDLDVDEDDVALISSAITTDLPGDENGEATVDGFDLVAIQHAFPGAMYTFGEWQQNYGAVAAAATATGIPEPSTVLLLLLISSLICWTGRPHRA